METNMILSASGWRKVFAISGDEQDRTAMIGEDNIAISIYSAAVFAEYIKNQTKKEKPIVIIGMDARPTGPAISEAAVKTFLAKGIDVKFVGITAAPEIMAYSKKADGFMYISASHNPVGHNGIKFGLNSGGVLNGTENAKLVVEFNKLCAQDEAQKKAFAIIQNVKEADVDSVYKEQKNVKKEALAAYNEFLYWTISGSDKKDEQEKIFSIIRNAACKKR